MKKTLLLLVTALCIHIGVPKTQAAANVSVDFFYDQLSDYGDWVEVGGYGYGWQPRDVDEDWRPYTNGGWAYTEAGWTWVSDEPYGWAVYHYGRWARLDRKGWVWIPGTEWAPAWVSWRRSPQHVGWAPLPPEASFRRSVGFSGWVDSYYDIGPGAYRFVEVRNFGAPQLRTVFVDPRENITIINQTKNITRITYVNNTVFNEGPRYDVISKQSAEPIRRLRLDRRVEVQGDPASFRGEQLRSRVEGESLHVFAPGFDSRSNAAPRKLSAKIDQVEVNHGWKDAGPTADVEKLRAKVRGEAKAPPSLPPQPKFERFAEQTNTPDSRPGKEKPVAGAPGEKPAGKDVKGDRKGEKPAVAVAPPAEPKVAPLENPVAPEAPLKPQKPGSKTGKLEKSGDPQNPGQPPAGAARAEVNPDRAVPPSAEAPGNPNPNRKGKNGKPQELPKPTPVDPVDPVEPKVKQERPEARRELPPPPERTTPKSERSVPPQPEPRREAPEPPKNQPRKPQPERPEAAREVPPTPERAKPKFERPNPQNAGPGNAPQAAPGGEAQKPKQGKGKGKDDKKPDEEASKAQ